MRRRSSDRRSKRDRDPSATGHVAPEVPACYSITPRPGPAGRPDSPKLHANHPQTNRRTQSRCLIRPLIGIPVCQVAAACTSSAVTGQGMMTGRIGWCRY
ncbi:hypothetical protein SETIT_1G303400v2 [Setaria italica]|uniref:Uncharacterized protein n=2 Tax=Setaria TaxID=4554 RepID=A0A368PRM5_SETIT|nr:hypothetical protein SETIT_1G303400v2 [Setaria italica]TKW41358.1 hypothetical protein SEVIR_1G309400v2 [Setaria viridis]